MEYEVLKGDITKVQADVIVNAANTSLLGGGGVDGAIHRAGGGTILEECRKIRNKQGGCAVGEAVITTAGKLPAKHVIHTVGPTYNGGGAGEREKLASCYVSSMALGLEYGMESIAFPCISTGVYRYPKQEAATIAFDTVMQFKDEDVLVKFVCFDDESYRLYQDLMLQAQRDSQ